MNPALVLLLSVPTLALVGCHATPLAQPSAAAPVAKIFGPVIAQQVIRGREEDGDAVLLLVDSTIVRIDMKRHRVSSTPIGVTPGEVCWGLAKLTDGSLWTLRGRNTIVRIEPDGRISRVIPLEEPHAGLFASRDRLIYQKAMPSPPDYALRGRVPGSNETTWSEIRVRSFPGIARAQASALSLVSCGRSLVAERACWFPDEAAVSLVQPDGGTRRIELIGLAPVAPEVLLTAENPRRPVRDAYIDDQSRIWVLTSGEAPADAASLRGGWMLARYSREGTPDGQVHLAEPARVILRVEPRRVIVLAGSGYVSEVATW